MFGRTDGLWLHGAVVFTNPRAVLDVEGLRWVKAIAVKDLEQILPEERPFQPSKLTGSTFASPLSPPGRPSGYPPGPPQIRTCPIKASGSSGMTIAAPQAYMAWYILGAESGNTRMRRTNFSHLMWLFRLLRLSQYCHALLVRLHMTTQRLVVGTYAVVLIVSAQFQAQHPVLLREFVVPVSPAPLPDGLHRTS